MDTWWKKILYSSALKTVAVIMICTGAFVGLIGCVGIASQPHGETVYDNYEIQDELERKAGFARDLIVRYRSDDVIGTITDEDIYELKENDPGLAAEQAKLQIEKDRSDYLRRIKRELEINNVNMDYFVKSLSDDIVLTNMDITMGEKYVKSDLESRNLYLVGDGAEIHSIVNNVNGRINTYPGSHYYYTGDESGEGYEVYVALKNTLQPGDRFYDISREYMEAAKYKSEAEYNLVLGIILLLLSVPYFILVVGRKPNREEVSITSFDRIPMEIQISIAVICAFGLAGIYVIVNEVSYKYAIVDLLYGNENTDISVILLITTIFVIGIILRVFASLIKHIKNRSLFYYIGVFRCIGKAKNYIIKNTVKAAKLKHIAFIVAGINFVAIFIIIFLLYMFDGNPFIPLFLVPLWTILTLIFMFKVIADYGRVIKGTKEIAEGNITSKIRLEGKFPVFNELAEAINTIGDGLDKAIAKSIRSERLKTELITNVSHDLKTPLTSIISYIDLLKVEEIDNEVAREYIDILDERSARLKHLIEDLVEASKAVTGNTKANTEMFSLDELVVQSVGEYTDRLQSSGINIVMQKIDKVYVEGDTKHMWRVTENLLSNITKYAMPNTRAYIEVKAVDEMGILTIKNISRDELNMNPEELTERFVRGEESRTTEGSGLGLAIASSLMNIQKGNLRVSIDGDLFKVEVKLPKVEDDKIKNIKLNVKTENVDTDNDSIEVNNVGEMDQKDINIILDKQ